MGNTRKIPQTIQNLIGEVGEGLVLFKLYELCQDSKKLEVFKNYSEPGYDCGIRIMDPLKKGKSDKVKIEVKARQRLISVSESKNSAHFTLTENERKCADFLVGYWLEYNHFFIVPVNDLNKVKSGEKDGKAKYVYKHIATRSASKKVKFESEIDRYTQKSHGYFDKWDLILEEIKLRRLEK
ncbi:hypothetical protein [Ekhidna sp.]|uniref:hypothetical protein n=1 Tax=Ekhidna sp. TaxID=2608089 RepID=UPI0032ECDD69